MKHCIAALAIVATAAGPAAAQDPTARAREILEAAAAAWKEAPAVAFDADLGMKARVALKRPDIARIEVQGAAGGLMLFDGKTCWYLEPGGKRYSAIPQTPDVLDFLLPKFGGPLAELYLSGAATVLARATDVAVTKEDLDGAPCDVVAWTVKGKRKVRVWIDGSRTIRRSDVAYTFGSDQASDYAIPLQYGTVELAPKLADDAFAFTPPKGATDAIDSLLPVGAQAPDFEAADVDGKTVKRSDFAGKTVLLVFWGYL